VAQGRTPAPIRGNLVEVPRLFQTRSGRSVMPAPEKRQQVRSSGSREGARSVAPAPLVEVGQVALHGPATALHPRRTGRRNYLAGRPARGRSSGPWFRKISSAHRLFQGPPGGPPGFLSRRLASSRMSRCYQGVGTGAGSSGVDRARGSSPIHRGLFQFREINKMSRQGPLVADRPDAQARVPSDGTVQTVWPGLLEGARQTLQGGPRVLGLSIRMRRYYF